MRSSEQQMESAVDAVLIAIGLSVGVLAAYGWVAWQGPDAMWPLVFGFLVVLGLCIARVLWLSRPRRNPYTGKPY